MIIGGSCPLSNMADDDATDGMTYQMARNRYHPQSSDPHPGQLPRGTKQIAKHIYTPDIAN